MTRDATRAAISTCAQNGIVLAQDLRREGITGKDILIARRAGELDRQGQGTYLLGGTTLDDVQRGHVALAMAGPDAVLTGLYAARLLRLRWVPDGGDVQVLVPADRRRRGSEGWLLVRRCGWIGELRVLPVNGLRVAPVAQVVVDACRKVTSLQDARGLVLGAVADRRCTVAEIRAILRKSAPAGTAWVRRACRDAERGATSPPEAEAADEFLGKGLPFYVNCGVLLGGVLLGVADVWLLGRGTGGELDSREWHAGAEDLDATLGRDKDFRVAGLWLEHITPVRFRADPPAFFAAVRGAADRRTALGILEPPGLTLKPRGPLLS